MTEKFVCAKCGKECNAKTDQAKLNVVLSSCCCDFIVKKDNYNNGVVGNPRKGNGRYVDHTICGLCGSDQIDITGHLSGLVYNDFTQHNGGCPVLICKSCGNIKVKIEKE